MQQAAFDASGLDARYVALDVRDFAAGWNAVGRLAIRGGNVTVPWKEPAALALDRVSREARLARGVNTFWRLPEGGYAGTQTDGQGFLLALEEAFGLGPRGLRAAVLGAGGGARAVLHALAEGGAAALYLWNRTPEKALRLAEELKSSGSGSTVTVLSSGPGAAALPRGHVADLLVNATSLGLGALDPAPADPAGFPGIRFAMDLTYGGRPSRFLEACARAGARTSDGRAMLLHQGAMAFELWWEAPAPLETMRAALTAALERVSRG